MPSMLPLTIERVQEHCMMYALIKCMAYCIHLSYSLILLSWCNIRSVGQRLILLYHLIWIYHQWIFMYIEGSVIYVWKHTLVLLDILLTICNWGFDIHIVIVRILCSMCWILYYSMYVCSVYQVSLKAMLRYLI